MGQSIHQEWYPGEATDIFLIVDMGLSMTLDNGLSYSGVLKTLDLNPLDRAPPNSNSTPPASASSGKPNSARTKP